MYPRIATFALLVVASLKISSCHKVKPIAALNTAGTAKLCIAGGATLDPDANICVCPENLQWTGQKCEAAHGAHLAEGEHQKKTSDENPHTTEHGKVEGALHGEDSPDSQESEHAEDSEHAGDHPEKIGGHDQKPHPNIANSESQHESKKPQSMLFDKLKNRCSLARGTFYAKDQFCICPDAKALVDRSCRSLQGKIIDDVCLRAPSPGKWVQGSCECPANKVFSPPRGGCVQPIHYAQKYTGRSGLPSLNFISLQKKSCESSINKGLWNADKLDCQCGTGKVFYQELCIEMQKLSSKEICETFGQRGRWNRDQKTCQCPIGKLWVNQRCTPYADISAEDGCHSNGSGGVWDSQAQSCLCPAGKVWAISGKSCRIAAH
jgi:hypothetical protein